MSADPNQIVVRRVGARESPLDDLYHRLMVARWPTLLILVIGTYLALNSVFAGLYLVGDAPIANARPGSFHDAFFFSVQAFSTIGFGNMYPQTAYGHLLVTAETLLGLLALATTTGLVFAKFSLPTARVRFARVAVVSDHEGAPTLKIRMANERANQIVDASVSLSLIREERTAEGELYRKIHDLPLLRDRSPVFAMSWTLFHPLDEASPLCHVDQAALDQAKGALIVVVTGLDGTHHQVLHARHTYRAEDILWGRRFADILREDADGEVVLDMGRFDESEPAPGGAAGAP